MVPLMLQHPDGLCHPERSEGSVNVSKATVLTYSDSSSYRPQNDIDSMNLRRWLMAMADGDGRWRWLMAMANGYGRWRWQMAMANGYG